MIDHNQRLSQPLPWSPRVRRALAALVALAVVAVVALGIYGATGGLNAKLRPGCIDVTFASSTGGAQLAACGARAREICASPGEARSIGQPLQAACRRAGDR
jgi:hypothetical protein